MQTVYYVDTVTNAIRGKRLLESRGIHAYIRRQTDRQVGCGYNLLVTNHSPEVESLLMEARIPFRVSEGRDSR